MFDGFRVKMGAGFRVQGAQYPLIEGIYLKL